MAPLGQWGMGLPDLQEVLENSGYLASLDNLEVPARKENLPTSTCTDFQDHLDLKVYQVYQEDMVTKGPQLAPADQVFQGRKVKGVTRHSLEVRGTQDRKVTRGNQATQAS